MTDDLHANLCAASRRIWDLIVIGGGPAGAVAARQATLGGLRTLLLDSKCFPRDKVCGGYLNSRACEVLSRIGVGKQLGDCNDEDVTQLEIARGHRRSRFILPHGRIICRSTFDAALLEAARTAGTTISTGTPATVKPEIVNECRQISVACAGRHHNLNARFVICADGLARSSIRHLAEFAAITHPQSRVGIGAVLKSEGNACPAGQITMALSRQGYVGISRIRQQQFNVAAAIDRELLLHSRPGQVVSDLLRDADLGSRFDVGAANWRGTPFLTSRPTHVASERIVLIGDAAGYVEPFTGEGIAAALESAVAVLPLAFQAQESWSPSIAAKWEALHWNIVWQRQRTCRQLAWLLRRPWASSAAINVCRFAPAVARRLIAKTSDSISYRMAAETNST